MKIDKKETTEKKIIFISDELKDFKPENYKFYGLWKQGLFSASFWVDCWDSDIANKLKLECEKSGFLLLTEGNFFVDKDEIVKIQSRVKEKILKKDREFFANTIKTTNIVFKSALEQINSLKNKKLDYKDLELIFNQLKKINFIWALAAAHFVVVGEEMLKEKAREEKYPLEKIYNIIPKVLTPLYYQNKEVIQFKEEIGDRNLEEIKKDRVLYKKIKAHIDIYPWIEIANFIGKKLSIDRLYEQISVAKSSNTEEISITANKISEELRFRAECMNQLGYIKQASAENFSALTEKIMPLLKKIAYQIGISYKQLLLLTHKEVLRAFNGELDLVSIKELVKRRKDARYLIFSDKNKGYILCESYKDIEFLKEIMLPKINKEYNEIKGDIASYGKVKGKVKIILNTDDFHKMKNGDILVTTMTTPDFVILMQKSSAIVTDIGGLLSHAAIVSRELKKPCIIGTKIATKILKDGDIVEVDADKGLIKILKKN